MNEKLSYAELEKIIRTQQEKIAELEAVFSSTSDLLCVVGTDGYFTYLNPEWENVLGFSVEELLSRPYLEFIHPEDIEITKKEIERLEKGETTPNFQNRYLCKDGTYKTLQWCASQAKGGKVSTIARDITKSKIADENLRQSETKFRNLIEGSIQGVLIHSHGLPLFVNQTWASLHGYSIEEILQMDSICTLIDPSDLSRMIGYKNARLQGEQVPSNYEYRGLRKDGSSVWLENSVKLIEWDGLPAWQVLCVNITDRKQVEGQLREISKIFHAFLEHSPVYIFFKNIELRPVYLSRNFETFFQMPLDTLLDKKMSEVFPAEFAKTLEKEEVAVLSGGKLTQVDETVNDTYFRSIKFPISLPNGSSLLAGILIDITDIKKLEEERDKFKSQYYQAQKMEAIGNLAGGIAHDFNNILSSILGYTELALDDAPQGSSQQDDLNEVYRAGTRAKQLVQQILAFARQAEAETKPVKLNDIVSETLKLLRPSTPSTIEIIPTINSTAKVIGNVSQLHQVVLNLCTNAVHALHKTGGILEIDLREISLKNHSDYKFPELPTGEYLKLTVTDNGPGIDPGIIEKIFDPYFTTKDVGEGTGMGLAMVKGIVESYGGDIQVNSKPGEKTSFAIRLPLAQGNRLECQEQVDPIVSGMEYILFVDDEPPIARMGSRILESLGYRVSTRTGSFEALELFKEKPDAFDLVISDMTMPAMTGDVLSMELRNIRPDIPIIICTGYSNKITEQQARGLGINAFIYKPFTKSDFAKTIREVLDAGC